MKTNSRISGTAMRRFFAFIALLISSDIILAPVTFAANAWAAEEGSQAAPSDEASVSPDTSPLLAAGSSSGSTAAPEPVAASGNVTVDFKDADIQNVLRILSFKSGVNIHTSHIL